jgi:predicted nucleic acid-binding protein
LTARSSSITIDHLRGRPEAAEFLDRLRAAGGLATHLVVVAEVLGGARDGREQREIERLFQEFRTVTITEPDSERSMDLFRLFRLAHGVGPLDCLIAATCIRCKLPIATLNERHFAVFEGLSIFRPY